ncbi:MAG: ImmA/IrrE family metallo-endopeptidase [Euryarchaeota archaeon]|nr:ImmA/IrrE family metallo-endopeptidase [Euryarchaeota archaeon]
MERVEIKPEMLQWAIRRSGQNTKDLAARFPKLNNWLGETSCPTLKQLENFANATSTPIGYLFLTHPLEEKVPIPDYRKIINNQECLPSPDLLETIYLCQQRQEWYRNFSRSMGDEPLPFVGKVTLNDDVVRTATEIRQTLDMDIDERSNVPTWTEALRRFIVQADTIGILVMVNGVVGSNNHRKLDPQEFRGFALSDDIAPLVFINGADTKAAQMFTLAHEIAHIWLGRSALSDAEASEVPNNEIEQWCNKVAAELLVPLEVIRKEYCKDHPLPEEMNRLAKYFKVSTLVILRRIHDAGGLNQTQMWQAYKNELQRLQKIPGGGGGDFYLTQIARVSRRFAQALVISTLEGQTLYSDAFHLLGFSKQETFQNLGQRVGVI